MGGFIRRWVPRGPLDFTSHFLVAMSFALPLINVHAIESRPFSEILGADIEVQRASALRAMPSIDSAQSYGQALAQARNCSGSVERCGHLLFALDRERLFEQVARESGKAAFALKP